MKELLDIILQYVKLHFDSRKFVFFSKMTLHHRASERRYFLLQNCKNSNTCRNIEKFNLKIEVFPLQVLKLVRTKIQEIVV